MISVCFSLSRDLILLRKNVFDEVEKACINFIKNVVSYYYTKNLWRFAGVNCVRIGDVWVARPMRFMVLGGGQK